MTRAPLGLDAMTTVRLIQTSPDGKRLADVSPSAWIPELETRYLQPAIVLNPTVRYQTLLGFGGAFTESACWTLNCAPGCWQK